MLFPKRGEIYLVTFDPAQGSEIKKTRPAVVIQNNTGNKHSSTTIIAPLTRGSQAEYPVEVLVQPPEGDLLKPSLILLDQIRVVDKSRLIKRLGKFKPTTMQRINQAVMISLGLIEV